MADPTCRIIRPGHAYAGKQGFNIVPSKSAEEAKTWLQGEIQTWKKITQEVKIDLSE